MLRKLVVVFTSVVLFAAAHAKALGLGEIVLESSLNQPLDARIALRQLGNVRPEQIQVHMAGEDDFARFSIQRVAFLDSVRFDVQPAGADAVVRLRTEEAVREPYLSFVLETRWPSGRLLSEYTVLLDLPTFAANANGPAVQQPVQISAQDQVDQNQPDTQGSSGAPERLAAAQASSRPEPAPAAVPAEEPVPADEPAPVATEPVPPTQPDRAASATAESVTIGADDTLWDVALRVRPDSSVSVQQTMLALQSLNREAFIADNINMVRRGQVLRVPSLEQIQALTAREAMSEVARQNQLFENRRNVPLTSQPVSAQPQATGGPTRGELTVVSVDNAEPASAQSAGNGQNAELDARIASLEDALAVQREEADRAALLNAELTERLGMLEQQIASAQEIIRLRDLELAQLQQSLAEAAAAQPEPVDPPTVITLAPEKTLVEQVLETLVANTYALLALVALVILMLVFVLLRRNRAAEQEAALAGMEGMPVVEDADSGAQGMSDDELSLNADVSDDELDEIMDLAGSADEALSAETVEDAVVGSSDSLEGADETAVAEDVLEEVDALIAAGELAEADTRLRDAIVAEPERVDLRMKLLEVYVARQDAVGFKLQETEIRDMGASGVEPRIATLRAQLHDDTDSEILEKGEGDFFEELSSLDDMEVALDLEASAEVDDDKVLAGAVVDDTANESPEAEHESAFDNNSVDFDFAPDEDAAAEALSEDQGAAEEAFDLSFASVVGEAQEHAAQEEAVPEDAGLSAAFDLSEPVTDEAPEADEHGGNDIDFDFDFAATEPETEAEAVTDEADAHEVEVDAEETGNDIDFDFAVLDDEEPAPANTEDAAPTQQTAAQEDASAVDVDTDYDLDLDADADEEAGGLEFDLDSDDDADIEFLDDDEEGDEAAVEADDTRFDLSTADADSQAVISDPFDDLQFVDDSFGQDMSDELDAEDEEDLDFLSDTDEAATKLDLARAYFEMGDKAGAREILEEVVKEGNEEQVKDARELLDKL